MRAGRLLIASMAGLALLAVLAAWLVPGRLDWDRYRPEIERLSSRQLGREVRIEGAIALTLLPQPVITASRIAVAGATPIRADALRLRIGLGALLSGHIEARELVLRGLDMRIPWPLPAAVHAVRAPDWLAAVSARIEQGRLSIGDVTFTGIDATLTTGLLSGTYSAVGTGELYGGVWRFTARLTQPGGDGSAALDATLDGQGQAQGIGARLSGQLGGDGNFGGRVSARGPDLSRLLPAPAVAFSAEGRVTVADGLAAADDLAVDIGGSPAQAAVALRVSPTPRLDVALAASRIDLNAWLPPLARASAGTMPLGIDLSAEAAELGGGTLRRLRAAADLSGTGAVIREFSAILPGEATARLKGQASRLGGGDARLEMEAALKAPRLRETLAWLDGVYARGRPKPIGATLPPGVLREAELTGHVSVTADRVSVEGIAGTLDQSSIKGTGSFGLGRRPAILARLALDRVALDRWVKPEAFDLGALEVDAAIDVGVANWGALSFAPLHLDASMAPGRATIRDLRVATPGVRAGLSGTLIEGGRIADGVLDVVADNAGQLAGWAPELMAWVEAAAPLLPRLPLHARAEFAGPARALVSRLAVNLGDLRMVAEPTLDVPMLGWSGTLTLRHPGAPRLAELLGLAGAPAWLGDGSLALVAQVAGGPRQWTATSFDLAAGALRASGQLALNVAGPERRLSGRIEADALPLPLPYWRSPELLPIPSLASWRADVAVRARTVMVGGWSILEQASGRIVVGDGVARLDGFTARLGGGQLSGQVALDTAREPRKLTAAMELVGATIAGPLSGLPLDLTAGTLDGRLRLEAAGNSPAGLLATAAGSLAAQARAGTLAGLDLARAAPDLLESGVRAGLEGGTMRFDHLAIAATLDRGQLTLDRVAIEAPSGELRITGAIDLPGASTALHVIARPLVLDAPELGLTITGSLAAPHRTPELAGAARWRVARTASADTPKP